MKLHVFVTRMIPDEGLKMLKKDKRLKVEVYEKDQKIPRKELLKRVKGADIILSILTERMDRQVFDAAGPQLKMIANYAVGFDNIDLAEAARRNILVTNAPNPQISESVAEHTAALILTLIKRIVETDAYTRAGKYQAWGPQLLLGQDVRGLTLGLIGTGAIGSAVARAMHHGFGMNIMYSDPQRNTALEKDVSATYGSLEEVLRQSDVISLHVPLLPSTRHLISTKQLRLMKRTAVLINTSRGPVIDEKALLTALSTKRIAGAALDVYECEPAIDCDLTDTLELRKMANVVLTPHTASATVGTRQAMGRVAAENILAFVDGNTPPNQVRPKTS